MNVRKIAIHSLTTATLLGGLTIGAAPAQASGGCWNAGFTVSYNYTYQAYKCHNGYGAPVWAATGNTEVPNEIVGYMYSNPSWFACKTDNGQYNGNNTHPYRWLFTQADNGHWGWMKDTDIPDDTNPVPSCESYWYGR